MRVILSAHYLTHFRDMLKELNFMSINDRITYVYVDVLCLEPCNNLTPKYIMSKFIPISRRHKHAARSSTNGNLQTCKFSTNYGKSTFRYKGAVTLNVICPNVIKIASLNYFNGWQLAKMKKSIPDMSLP